MADPHALPRQVEQALARGWTVLTANQRAARTLRHAYDLHQQARGLPNWQPPSILAWDTWLASLWHRLLLEGHASALLLNASQEHTLWRAVIQADQQSSASLKPLDSLAELAAAAWLLLHAYRGRRRLHAAASTTDTRAFDRWANEFDRRATRSSYLTAAQLPEALRAAIAAGQLTPAPGLLLLGFDTKTPAQTALLEALQTTGAELEESNPRSPGAPSIAPLRWVGHTKPEPTEPAPHALVAALDEHDELATCARWLRTHLTANPTDRLAVIVPALETARTEIDRIFRHILAPELEDIAAPTPTGPFEFSLGVPLPQTPLASTAFDILSWSTGPLPLDRVSALLLSPHFAPEPPNAAPEHLARAEFDAFILRRKSHLQPEISLDALYTLASHPKSAERLPVLLTHLRILRAFARNQSLTTKERTHAEWAAAITDILEAAGWSSSHRDSSVEFQTRRRWESALDELATLDFEAFDAHSVSFPTALAALRRIAAQTLFAPESRHAPIQIMGPLESAGFIFDAIWFLHASDLSWPATPASNPLLPWQLQRELGTPGIDPARDAAHARRITERIATSAPTIVFSYAQETPDGHQRPSPILTSLPLEASTAALLAPAPAASEPIVLETAAETEAIPPPPDRVLEGGAAILESQAACGFRAFAEKRLFSTALDTADLGLDPGERGTLVHKVLESFWANVESQAALKQLSRAHRDAQLAASIDQVLRKHTAATAPGWNLAYLATERQRLLNLLGLWLDYEANQRSPFTVKSREEKLADVRIGPLRLDIRVDRIDQVPVQNDLEEAGGEIILDYKTGTAKPSEWLGERPDAPQLPLYAVVSESQQLAAVAFGSVRAGKDMGLNGYEARSGVLPRSTRLKTDTLAVQVEEWRTVLTVLAEDFHSGQAQVSPKQYPVTCKYCDQRLLCRLNPTSLDADALEELAEPTPYDDESDEGLETEHG